MVGLIFLPILLLAVRVKLGQRLYTAALPLMTSVITTLMMSLAWADTTTPSYTLKLSAEQVWQREQVMLTLEVHTQDPFARLESKPFKQEGFSIITLPSTFPSSEEQPEETASTSHTLIKKWAIYPLISGTHLLKLPRIRFRPNRGRIKTLAISNPTLQVRALPLYVPPTMPIGKISLSQSWDKTLTQHTLTQNNMTKGTKNGIIKNTLPIIITPFNLYQWTIIVTGKGVVRQNMPPISRQLINTDDYEFYPSQRSQDTLITEQGITQVSRYTIPTKATQSGKPSLPKIAVQYFDPASGKLFAARLNPPFLVALNKYIQWLIALSLIAISITLLIIASLKIKKRLRQILQYRRALHSLEKASTYQQVRSALNEISKVKKWGGNLNLAEFLDRWKQQPGLGTKDDGEKLKAAIERLQTTQFSGKDVKRSDKSAINQIAKALLDAIKTD